MWISAGLIKLVIHAGVLIGITLLTSNLRRSREVLVLDTNPRNTTGLTVANGRPANFKRMSADCFLTEDASLSRNVVKLRMVTMCLQALHEGQLGSTRVEAIPRRGTRLVFRYGGATTSVTFSIGAVGLDGFQRSTTDLLLQESEWAKFRDETFARVQFCSTAQGNKAELICSQSGQGNSSTEIPVNPGWLHQAMRQAAEALLAVNEGSIVPQATVVAYSSETRLPTIVVAVLGTAAAFVIVAEVVVRLEQGKQSQSAEAMVMRIGTAASRANEDLDMLENESILGMKPLDTLKAQSRAASGQEVHENGNTGQQRSRSASAATSRDTNV